MALERLARVYEAGAVKYGDHNWKKGQPLSRFLDSAMRHTSRAAQGHEDEDHLFQAVWNLVGLAWTLQQVRDGALPVALVDLPYHTRASEKAPGFDCRLVDPAARALELQAGALDTVPDGGVEVGIVLPASTRHMRQSSSKTEDRILDF